jgi:hypothetical protein
MHGIVGLLDENVAASQLPDLSSGPSTPVGKTSLNLTLEAYRGLQVAQSYVQEVTESKPDKILKTEVFELNAKLAPFKIVSKKENFLFPFSIGRNSAILIGRNFSTQRAANSSGVYRLQDLPLNIENAEKMSVGDYVAMPVKLSVLANYSGHTLQDVFQKSGALKNLLSASAFGTAGASIQGGIVGNGDFTLHIIKVAPQKVRVRVSVGNSLQLSASGDLSVGGNANINFLPHTALERGVSIGRTLGRLKMDNLQKQNELTFNRTFELLGPNQKRLAAGADWTLNLDFKTQLNAASQTNDSALEHVPNNEGDKVASQEILKTKAKQAASKAQIDWIDKIVKTTEELDRLRNHSFQMSANVSLNSTVASQFHSLGEYVFDLSSEEGRASFLHAVSGRSRWVGDSLSNLLLSQSGGESSSNQAALLDLTLADDIAVEDQFKSRKRVERIQLVETKKFSRSNSIQFGFLNASMGFSEDRTKNQVALVDGNGPKITYDLSHWRFQKKGLYAGIKDTEIRSSGFYSKSQSDVLAAYYYSWSMEKSDQSSALREPLKHLLNVLGPEFYRSKIHLAWPSDYSGSAASSLEVVINQNGIDRFFKTDIVSEDSFWIALRQIAETWDNTFGLPFNNFGGLNTSVVSEEASKSCAVISKEWGAAYCKYLSDVFLPSWRLAASKSRVERIRFFGEFYKQGFLANKIGVDLMMRIVLQVLANSRRDPNSVDYMLKVQSFPKGLANTNQIIDYQYGSDPLHGVSEVLGLKMLIQ